MLCLSAGMSAATYYQSVIHATWLNNQRKPLDDPRVRRALHLVLDRPALVEVVKDVAPLMVGGFLLVGYQITGYMVTR